MALLLGRTTSALVDLASDAGEGERCSFSLSAFSFAAAIRLLGARIGDLESDRGGKELDEEDEEELDEEFTLLDTIAKDKTEVAGANVGKSPMSTSSSLPSSRVMLPSLGKGAFGVLPSPSLGKGAVVDLPSPSVGKGAGVASGFGV